MISYSVTFQVGDDVGTIYFESDNSLTEIIATIADRGALVLPPGSSGRNGQALKGSKAIMSGYIVSVQEDKL